ncbi:toxin glutamine deamidase domain-containing protein [Actinoallomurus acaciae]|uniref:Toxin glutamine deamidase domain-containing protein n=1 Tax=Actinoallomurus acaciae TaxID=502577 RepID=A0ABV5YL68_9ACTN
MARNSSNVQAIREVQLDLAKFKAENGYDFGIETWSLLLGRHVSLETDINETSIGSSRRPGTPFRPGAPGRPPMRVEAPAGDSAEGLPAQRGARPLPEPPALPDGMLPSDAEYGDEDVPTSIVLLPTGRAGEAAVSGGGRWPRLNQSIPGVTSLPSISRDTWTTHPDPAGRAAAKADVARLITQRFPSLSRLNPTGNELNCNGAVLAVDYMLDGHTKIKIPPASTRDFYGAFRLKDRYQGRWVTVVDYDGIIEQVRQRPGNRGAVYIARPDGSGHLFNVVNTDDGVVFLDGQAGTLAELPADAQQIGLLLYHPDDKSPTHLNTSAAASTDGPPIPPSTVFQPRRHPYRGSPTAYAGALRDDITAHQTPAPHIEHDSAGIAWTSPHRSAYTFTGELIPTGQRACVSVTVLTRR